MTAALWVVAACQVIRTMLDLRARKLLHLPKVFKRNEPVKRSPRVTEIP